jgi:hypothetical protein
MQNLIQGIFVKYVFSFLKPFSAFFVSKLARSAHLTQTKLNVHVRKLRKSSYKVNINKDTDRHYCLK